MTQLAQEELITVSESRNHKTLLEIQSDHYADIPKPLLDDIRYLEQLATATSRKIGHIKPEELLQGITPGDRRAINQVFFAIPEVTHTVNEDLLRAGVTQLEGVAVKLVKNRLVGARGDLSNARGAAHSAMLRYRNAMKDIVEAREMVARLSRSDVSHYIAEFRKAAESPFFELIHCSNGKAFFVTRGECVMRQKSAALGIDISVNFGRIIVRFDMEKNYLTAHPYENNVTTHDDYFHPYISDPSDGSICFGSHSELVAGLMADGKLSEVLEILAALLVTFDPSSSPYIALDTFHQELLGDRYDKEGDSCEPAERKTPRKCGECRLPRGICNCITCTLCDEKGHHREDCPTYCPECGNPTADGCRCGEKYCDSCEHYDSDCGCEPEDCDECSNRS